MNKFIAIGRLTRDPELKYSSEGKAYCYFSIAINRQFKQDETDFFNCVTFGKGAEALANYMGKGNQIAVEGSVEITKKEDKYFTNVVAQNVQFLESKQNNQSQGNNPQQSKQSTQSQNESSKQSLEDIGEPVDLQQDDLPF